MYWHTKLADEAANRRDQKSFHVFAEDAHSDARGQILNLAAGTSFKLWTTERPSHLFIILVLRGELDAALDTETIQLRHLSQLVVTPGNPCELRAESDATIEVISFESQPPTSGS